MGKLNIRTEPLRTVENVLGANARNDENGYLTPTVNTINLANPLKDYALSDKDDDASPNYYGYVAADGSWYIIKETISAGADTYRFIKGSANYTTNWTNRASLVYDYFYTIF